MCFEHCQGTKKFLLNEREPDEEEHLVVTVVAVLGSIKLVTDQAPTTDHLADSEDAVSLDSVDADLLPVTFGEEVSPVGLVGDLGVDLTVCRGDAVKRGGRGEAFGDVDLLCDGACDRKVVLDGLRVACCGCSRE